MSYDAWLEKPYQDSQRFNPGEEDRVGLRLFLPEEDQWATVECGEPWEDAEQDSDGTTVRYGGTDYVLVTDWRWPTRSSRVRVTMTENELDILIEEQYNSPIRMYDPTNRCTCHRHEGEGHKAECPRFPLDHDHRQH